MYKQEIFSHSFIDACSSLALLGNDGLLLGETAKTGGWIGADVETTVLRFNTTVIVVVMQNSQLGSMAVADHNQKERGKSASRASHRSL